MQYGENCFNCRFLSVCLVYPALEDQGFKIRHIIFKTIFEGLGYITDLSEATNYLLLIVALHR